MKLRKFLSIILASAMVASTMLMGIVNVSAAEFPFEDVPDKWYKNAVTTVYNEGIMQGKSDVKFDPTANITRAEVVTAFARVACTNIKGKGESLPFTDTKTGKWYSDSVGWAAECGIVNGRGDGRFSPSDLITRAELASIIVNFVNYMELELPDAPKIDSFKDADTFAKWSQKPIEAVRKTGLMQGVNGSFNPKGNASRAEIAQVITNLLPNIGRVDVVADGKTDYTVVYDEANTKAAERLQYQLKSLTGAEIDISTDTTVNGKVIKLGAPSGISADGLGATGYRIDIDGDNILINGEADGVYKAVVRLTNNCAKNGGFHVTEKTAETFEHEYPIGSLTINGNDIAKYVIKYTDGASASVVTAAGEMQKYIEKACGVKLAITTGDEGSLAIILDDKAFTDDETFSVKTKGDNIIIGGSRVRGVIYGVYDFLENCVGWKFVESDYDYLKQTDSLDISDVDYTVKPYFEFRKPYWYCIMDSTFAVKHKINATTKLPESLGGYHDGRGQGCHTFEALTDGQYDQSTQPCLSDPEIFDLILGNVIKQLEANPNVTGINVSQNDNGAYCQCEKCEAVNAEEGSTAGTVIRFVNAIAEEVEKKYPDVYVQTLAYMFSRKPPKTLPRHNVVIQLCSIECCFGHALTDETCSTNVAFVEDLKSWSEVCDKLYIWDYTTNFSRYITPFINYDYEVLAANVRLFHENNVIGLMEQGNYQGESGEFGEMRAYLLAKLMWDPYMSEEQYYAYMDEFLEAYYGEGWENIRVIIDTLIEKSQRIHFPIFERDYNLQMYVRKDLESYVTLFEEMELKAESYQLKRSLDRSQMQFEYMYLNAFFVQEMKSGDEARIAAIQQKSHDFQDKFAKLGVRYSEQRKYPDIKDITEPPMYWATIWDN